MPLYPIRFGVSSTFSPLTLHARSFVRFSAGSSPSRACSPLTPCSRQQVNCLATVSTPLPVPCWLYARLDGCASRPSLTFPLAPGVSYLALAIPATVSSLSSHAHFSRSGTVLWLILFFFHSVLRPFLDGKFCTPTPLRGLGLILNRLDLSADSRISPPTVFSWRPGFDLWVF